jgi:alkylation response protein AidB-like acyl-CoA dehydrogenase
MRAWLIGKEGHGIHEISTLLNITRAHTTVSSVGYLGRSLAVARGLAAVREVGVGRGRRVALSSHPLHMRTLANLAVDYHGLMLLVYYTVYLVGLDERPPPPPTSSTTSSSSSTPPHPPHPLTPTATLLLPLLGLLPSLHKSFVCSTSVPHIYACMESLGGVGYLLNEESQHINVARLFRDAWVAPSGWARRMCWRGIR